MLIGMKLSLYLAFLLGCALSAVAGGDICALAEHVAATYGGQAALEKAAILREEGMVESAMRSSSTNPVIRVFSRPRKLRVEVRRTPQPEVRVLSDAKGWRDGKKATGPGYDAMVLQALRLDLPWQLFRHQHELVSKPDMEHEGHHLGVLEFTLEGGLVLTAGIDRESGRILYSSGTIKGGEMGPTKFETYYDDFKTVDGVLFAFKETNMAQGMKTAETKLRKIEILKAEPAEAFVP
jgi:hypothetical protein